MDNSADTCPLNLAVPISVSTVDNSFKIKVQVLQFNLLPPTNFLSDFEDDSAWSTLSKGFDTAINDPIILLDKYIPSDDHCNDLVESIRLDTASIVLDESFNPASLLGPAGSSAVIIASSTKYNKKCWNKGCNWVTGPESSQSAYCSELAGVISSLTILDILVRHHNITEGAAIFSLN